jgi:hypothetical protein
VAGVNEPGPEPEGGDPACWAQDFEELLFGEVEAADHDGDDDDEHGPSRP